jgi:enoyl-CoA hydratase
MLRCVLEERLGRLVLDAPQEKNKLSIAFLEDAVHQLENLDYRGIDQLVLHSSSKDIFAAGANMHELLALNPETAMAYAALGQRLMSLLENAPVPVTALVSGPCFGGGFDLVLACSEIWATPSAVFCHPGVFLGIMTGFGGTIRLPQRIPPHMARWMLLTGYRMKADEAQKLGLVDRMFLDYDKMLQTKKP